MNELIDLLSDIRPDVDFINETRLMDDCILDSLDVVTIITEIFERFDVSISPENITSENFNSANCLYKLILSLGNK